MFLAAPQPSLAQASAPPVQDGAAYLQFQAAEARRLQAHGKPVEALRAVDKALSLIASSTNPQVAAEAIAEALAESLSVLVDLGEIERAFGLHRATGPLTAARLAPGSAQEGRYRFAEARLLAATGDAAGAVRALEAALPGLAAPDGAASRSRLADALSDLAVLRAARGNLPGAREALGAHPLADAYGAGEPPSSGAAVTYLAARALVAAFGGGDDPLAARSLAASTFPTELAARQTVAIRRAAGLALAVPPGPARQAGLADLGRRLAAGADERPDALTQLLIGLALTQAGSARSPGEAAIVFSLVQLLGRANPTFDADALTALGGARDEAGRRAVHQALRLRARRDRAERAQIRQVLLRAAQTTPAQGRLGHDIATRLVFRDFAVRLAQAQLPLARGKAPVTWATIVPLVRLQAVLAPDEVALAVAPTAGGYAYMCVRRERTMQAVRSVDLQRVRLDSRLVQAALTATHAPDVRLDRQFPMEAAVRLHEALIGPFETCLTPGDRIVWLGGVAGTAVPLAALPLRLPPRVEGGYDLAQADWLVRRHAVTYAGAASVVVATRGAAARTSASFDFLGVGDPVLTGPAARGAVRLDSLAALPETRAELEASAQGFRSARLLLQDQATERRLRAQLTGEYRFLSFATHGLLRDDLEGLSEPALVLTPATPGDPSDDGLLTTSEIADLNLAARFVALSACNTANFDLSQIAQDLPALASAFAVAGVPSTLATLWPVNSETGQQVVASVFNALQRDADVDPAIALADAQRAFLAAPPGAAYLHPRFWAPFVMLGDGGGAPRTAKPSAGLRVAAVDILTREGGEVMALDPSAEHVAARYIADADASGRHGEGVRVSNAEGHEIWRHESHGGGASRVALRMGDRTIVSGYGVSPKGRFAPTLDAYAVADGVGLANWRGDDVSPVDGFIAAGVQLSPDRAVIAVVELNLRDAPAAGGGRLHLLALGPDLRPTPWALATAPPGTVIEDVTLSRLGADLVLTYAAAGLPAPQPDTPDDYDAPDCRPERMTWVELLDGQTGAVKASATLDSVGVVAATEAPGGRILLGGARRSGCGDEDHAIVLSLDPRLTARPVWRDDSLGASQVRALASLPDGRAVVAASKASVVDYRPPAAGPARFDAYRPLSFAQTFSGLVLVLDRKGAARPPKLLDSGSNVYVTALAGGPDVLLGGSVGGEAAILRLTEPSD